MDLCFLSVDVGISHLAVLVPGKEKGAASLNSEHIAVTNGKLLIVPIDSHEEEARAHVVRGGTHPYVPMLLKVL